MKDGGISRRDAEARGRSDSARISLRLCARIQKKLSMSFSGSFVNNENDSPTIDGH